MPLVMLSHLVNLLVAGTVAAMIFRAPRAAEAAYGPDTDARRILGCLYGAIAAASGVAIAAQPLDPELPARIALVLFPLQIAYKIATAPAVGLASPVVRANLAISALHALSLGVLLLG